LANAGLSFTIEFKNEQYRKMELHLPPPVKCLVTLSCKN